MTTEQIIRRKLQEALTPSTLEIKDDSHKHAGHAEAAKHGGGHYTLIIGGKKLEELSRIQQHRLIYDILDDEFKAGKIHALKIIIN